MCSFTRREFHRLIQSPILERRDGTNVRIKYKGIEMTARDMVFLGCISLVDEGLAVPA